MSVPQMTITATLLTVDVALANTSRTSISGPQFEVDVSPAAASNATIEISANTGPDAVAVVIAAVN